MDRIIEIDKLKLELKETQKMYLELLYKIDKVKMKLQEDKVSKKEIIKIIDGE